MGQKPEKRNGRYKFFIVAGLLVVVSALTCYFHLVFGIGAVFTHLFYIPVILASFWWRRKGVAVAVLLAVLLVFSRIFLGANVVTVNDYLRAVMFIVIGFVVAQLSRRIAQEHQQLEAVNQQLRASEQQLKAANQQLRADEQQLRAANQQLRADEQQLKAANQQLGATEQQLKAANQQLRAGEQQLKAANQQLRADEQQLRAANQQLRASEQQLRAEKEKAEKYFDVAATIMVVIGLDEKVVRINKKGCEILGYKRSRIIGRNWFDNFLPENIRQEAKKVFQQLISGKIKSAEYHRNPVLTKTGEERIIAWHNAILKDEQGKISGTLSSGSDITERKKAEDALRESEERFRNLMEYIPGVSVQGYDIDGIVFYWNKASEDIYGYTADEAMGKNLGDLIIPSDLKPLFEKGLEVARTINSSGELLPAGELMLLHKNGHLVPVYSIHTAVKVGGKKPLLFCIDVDLSERMQAEKKLLSYQKQLKALASQLTLVEENERHRIATDLHATVAQSLVISKIKLDALRTSVPSRDIAKTLGEVCESLDETIQGTRSLTFDLSSPILY
ncbi:MAG: hypothetical protein DRP62_03170, partial [Planctomycetota bacterium]